MFKKLKNLKSNWIKENWFKPIIVLLLAFFLIAPNFADAYVRVKGYYRKNGTYVKPHVRSNPNGLKSDNYGYKPSQGVYNKTYGTKGAKWDTSTTITDPDYYEGKSLYESGTVPPSYNSSSSYTPQTKIIKKITQSQKSNLYQLSQSQSTGQKYSRKLGFKNNYVFTQRINEKDLVSKMIKAETGNKVYTVDKNSCLRWMKNEQVAKRLYGNTWNQHINTIDDALLFTYKFCEPINE